MDCASDQRAREAEGSLCDPPGVSSRHHGTPEQLAPHPRPCASRPLRHAVRER
jgi:hypothetical protein